MTDITQLDSAQWVRLFETNIHSFFYLCKVGDQLDFYERAMLTTAWV